MQDIEPMFVYYDDVRCVYNFGKVRLGTTDIYMTTCLRRYLDKGLVKITNISVNLNMKTVNYKAFKVSLEKGVNNNIKDERKVFNNGLFDEENRLAALAELSSLDQEMGNGY